MFESASPFNGREFQITTLRFPAKQFDYLKGRYPMEQYQVLVYVRVFLCRELYRL